MKRCRNCRSTKPLESFPRNPNTADGRHDFCHRCWYGDKQAVAKKTVRNEAINRLIDRHRAEFDDLVDTVRSEQERLPA